MKDSENAATTPAAPGATSRPQPVALEVPVMVNGARGLDGSDKREPFSERSQTVLVFGHGAVIRVSAPLAPGQLIFLTNEKTRKEVVCQVVKSKSDGSAVGYVELRFTEPAPGFWGMRFPADTVLPQAAPRPAGPPIVPPPAKVAPPAPPVTPIAPKSVAPPAPIAVKPVVPAPPAPSAPLEFAKPSAAPARPSFEANAYPLPMDAVEEIPHTASSAPPRAPADAKPAPATSADPKTEELKQQAARLQQQLSSLLFTEPPKPAGSVSAASPSSKETANLSDVAQKVFFEPTASDSASVNTEKSIPPSSKVTQPSLAAEEIKIPAWLAPLARETDSSSPVPSPIQTAEAAAEITEHIAPEPAEEAIFPEPEEPARRPETTVFGGQLLGESLPSFEESGSKSRVGLFLGIAAALLLVAGGFWYSQQPGNVISQLLAGVSSTSHSPSVAQETPAPAALPPASGSSNFTATASSTPERVNPRAETPVASTPAINTPAPTFSRNSNFTSTPVIHTPPVASASRGANPASKSAPANTAAEVEEPEPAKPSLGEVRLATPKIHHGKAAPANSDAAPAIDVNETANLSAPLSTLSSSHTAGPAAPVTVGGDVKPAKLIKSVPPVYPDIARNQHVAGSVQIDALIGADGGVSTMKVLSGPPLLHQAALEAVKQWKFHPAQLNGQPTTMHLTVTVQFRTQ